MIGIADLTITFEWSLSPHCDLSRDVLNVDDSVIDPRIFEFRAGVESPYITIDSLVITTDEYAFTGKYPLKYQVWETSNPGNMIEEIFEVALITSSCTKDWRYP